MTNQQVFNRVARHLIRQGRQSKNGDSCRYRSDDGLKCAIGCLIPNSRYSSKLEGRGVTNEVLKAAGLLGRQVTMALHLQLLHDHNDPSVWTTKLKELADLHRLKMPKCKGPDSIK